MAEEQNLPQNDDADATQKTVILKPKMPALKLTPKVAPPVLKPAVNPEAPKPDVSAADVPTPTSANPTLQIADPMAGRDTDTSNLDVLDDTQTRKTVKIKPLAPPISSASQPIKIQPKVDDDATRKNTLVKPAPAAGLHLPGGQPKRPTVVLTAAPAPNAADTAAGEIPAVRKTVKLPPISAVEEDATQTVKVSPSAAAAKRPMAPKADSAEDNTVRIQRPKPAAPKAPAVPAVKPETPAAPKVAAAPAVDPGKQTVILADGSAPVPSPAVDPGKKTMVLDDPPEEKPVPGNSAQQLPQTVVVEADAVQPDAEKKDTPDASVQTMVLGASAAPSDDTMATVAPEAPDPNGKVSKAIEVLPGENGFPQPSEEPGKIFPILTGAACVFFAAGMVFSLLSLLQILK